ncbi:MAG: LCP family protein [Acidimicrobiia bacterium]|nr:LCP family protein [Acidimicrobiia bacterium]NNF09213.1 LCP family protein [Acidimicrobiia bacterium]NNL69636.1 LCP family protein [Acidimicrobiia bacterium]
MQRTVAPSASLSVGLVARRVFVALLVVANVAVFAVLFYLNGLKTAVDTSIEQIPSDDLPALAAPAGHVTGPLYVLLVGSDNRENLDDLENFGYFEGQRADVIMLFRVDASANTAQLISLPRDLMITRGDGSIEKLNATYSRDANELIETVSSIAGVAINHYVEIDFVGFASIVDELGGIDFYFALPTRDIRSGLDVPAGVIHMDGETALAYARARNLEEFVNGAWQAVPGNDLNRTKRQQELVFTILNEVKRPTNLLDMGELVGAIGDQIKTDAGLDYDRLRDLAWDMRSFDTQNLEALTLPVYFDTIQGISYVRPLPDEAPAVLASFRAGEALTGTPEQSLRVEVRNGNGRNGAAAEFGAYVESLGHIVASVGNADRMYQETVVITRPGLIEDADRFVAQIGFGTVQDGNLNTGGIDLIVYLGVDADYGAAP